MEDSTINILKTAILLERRGKTFYRKAAEYAKNDAVKRFFELMASEEQMHVEILSKQFKEFIKEKKFVTDDYHSESNSKVSAGILTGQVKQKISAAGFEAAAISAAMAMEERAIKLYSQGAATSDTSEKKALYDWLVQWEREHLRVLVAIDRELTERVWYDNQFWPF